jgi:hypothetical protein
MKTHDTVQENDLLDTVSPTLPYVEEIGFGYPYLPAMLVLVLEIRF